VASVGRVLNGLGARIVEMLSQERALSADLSHRLRTPVTALRLDAESLADPDDRARMTRHVETLTTAVDAAVNAARHPGSAGARATCDAASVVRDRAEFWSLLAEETGRAFAVCTPPEPTPVLLTEELLGAALDALLDNVFSHTPAGTRFAMRVVRTAGRSTDVVVEDDGPGIPAGGPTGRDRTGSTGIGLDLARRTVEQAGGQLLVHGTESGGTRVVMSFPPLIED
jgi:signal transduction histidine kinase